MRNKLKKESEGDDEKEKGKRKMVVKWQVRHLVERRNVTIINTRWGTQFHFRAQRGKKQEVTCFSRRRLTSRLKSSFSNSESLSLLKKELLKELLFRFGSEALWVGSGLRVCPRSLGGVAAGAAGRAVWLGSRLCSCARLTENLPTRASGLVVT